MEEKLPIVKQLFEKIYNAHIYCLKHPQETNKELWDSKILPLLDSYYNQLEKLGVPPEFSMCLFVFGIDYLQAVRSWKYPKTL